MGNTSDAPAPVTSGIQVLDRALLILGIVARRPHSLSELCETTGLPRATAHRIAVALEKHRMVTRLDDGQWTAGPALAELAPKSSARLDEAAEFVLPNLVKRTGESVQLYKLSGNERICVATAEPPLGLRDTVPVGSRMTLTAGSAAKVLVAYAPPAFQASVLEHSVYSAADLEKVRMARVAESIGEREPVLASASVPVRDATGVIAALSISGPVDRMGPSPAALHREALQDAAAELEAHLR
ncbi:MULTISPECIES: IclR family transcriptional regulator [Actinomycetes]|jgi:DNA-binding IclR family transcriptional regulator|uniref:IclR family transcriptional regulator n=1 Tax=Corynebacterium nuruki TaxID=1032851 RepID=A0A3D4SX70_9CORY|nr:MULTISPECIES: IclR family transcriptional regulator [Actinomycetes]MDN6428003.1 IclR family transcriptional regulator [Acidipropionibacterium jensenii]HCT13878.1 IclR family transcriptional regulator [Corynebacterium nuruki]